MDGFKQVAGIIRNEHPQIQTIVLAYLDPEQSAEILAVPGKGQFDDDAYRQSGRSTASGTASERIMEKQLAGQAGTQAAKMGDSNLPRTL